MRDLGIYFGTFAPCHVGHFEQVIRAKRENRHAFVIVSGYAGDRGSNYGMILDNRVKAMRQLLGPDDNVTVLKLDETHIPRYPHGWEPWLEMLSETIMHEKDTLPFEVGALTFYVGEEEYIEPLQYFFSRVYPDIETKVTMVDRKILGISGTSIRESPILNWDYVMRPFRRFFVQNVLVIGAPGTGRTSMVQDLARRYSTSYSTEYAKTYCKEQRIAEDELDVRDFHAIGIGQFENNRHHIHSPGTRKVFFADTDVMTTKVSMKMYADGEEFNRLKSVFDYYIHLQNWSLILVLPPEAPLDETVANTDYQNTVHQMIMAELEEQNLLHITHTLDGTSYRDRYQEAHRRVDEILMEGKDN
ncbi:AAA family ATPase [Salinicoccus sp. ID82-1]|uniref:AAA family ATPase n=1 Tax=Salinicoccus sp. ID82-1 TaxID=2820269 RepID=UPI001F2F7EDA|nr:AAA family ATPase [Salinicoccus sp. ID82-1]